jgi:ABC-type uncharacterized transport system permease subunit
MDGELVSREAQFPPVFQTQWTLLLLRSQFTNLREHWLFSSKTLGTGSQEVWILISALLLVASYAKGLG